MAAQIQTQATSPVQEEPRLPQRTRSRHSDLQPLTTTQIHAARQRGMMMSYRHPLSSPISALSLGSPTISLTRQYYLENRTPLSPVDETPTTQQLQYIETPISHTDGDRPRRHSSDLMTPVRLSNRLSRVRVSSPSSSEQSPMTPSSNTRTLAEESRLQLLDGVDQGELARLGTIVSRYHPIIPGKNSSKQMGKVPPQYIRDRLHRWGRAYLCNDATADAFVKAVHLRRPTKKKEDTEKWKGKAPGISEKEFSLLKSKNPEKEDDPITTLLEEASKLPSTLMKPTNVDKPLPPLPSSSISSSISPPKTKLDPDLVTIRARVIPKAKERKPFLIQRQINMKELRVNRIPDISSTNEKFRGDEEFVGLGRSKSVSARGRAGLKGRNEEGLHGRRNGGMGVPGSSKKAGVMPIHIEYILPTLPLLAALLLSGHVRKGDTIDLPIPHPEVWDRVVEYIYLGKGEVSGAMRENIEFLGGWVGN